MSLLSEVSSEEEIASVSLCADAPFIILLLLGDDGKENVENHTTENWKAVVLLQITPLLL